MYRAAQRNKLVELAAAAKQLDRLLDGNGSDDEDHFGEAFAAAGLDMKAADVDALAPARRRPTTTRSLAPRRRR